MQNKITLLSIACCLFGGAMVSAHADDVEVSLGNKFGEFRYQRDAAFLGLPDGDASIALLMTENNIFVGHATIDTQVLADATPLEISVGARLYLVSLVEPDDDVMGLGFGASARYRLPFQRLPILKRFPFHIAASIYFAPEITTSGTSIDITDIHVIRGELELTPNIDGVVGLRTIDVDRGVIGEDDIVDERIYVGVKIRF